MKIRRATDLYWTQTTAVIIRSPVKKEKMHTEFTENDHESIPEACAKQAAVNFAEAL
jgi:hypothetical protein